MIEIPEATTIARQAGETLTGRRVVTAQAGHTPHKFTWYKGDPERYASALADQTVVGARALARYVELDLGDQRLAFSDGARPRWLAPGAPRPAKHQLLLELDDGSALVCTVQMYAGIALIDDDDDTDFYYQVARDAPSPLTGAFTVDHLRALAADAKPTLSAKGLLATEQRIPGLGNGCLQDILFTAGIHPQRQTKTLDDDDLVELHRALVATLQEMTDAGGRDTETDLFGKPGGYPTILSAKTRDLPCRSCGGSITRKAFLGGNVYFCPACQPLGDC
ncbi:MAG: hypothetical protein FWF02_11075 [Micrococcales bacterium]|nr:hypothetical protein [Micrococcales bacterium]